MFASAPARQHCLRIDHGQVSLLLAHCRMLAFALPGWSEWRGHGLAQYGSFLSEPVAMTSAGRNHVSVSLSFCIACGCDSIKGCLRSSLSRRINGLLIITCKYVRSVLITISSRLLVTLHSRSARIQWPSTRNNVRETEVTRAVVYYCPRVDEAVDSLSAFVMGLFSDVLTSRPYILHPRLWEIVFNDGCFKISWSRPNAQACIPKQ